MSVANYRETEELDVFTLIRTVEAIQSPVLFMDELMFVLGHEDFERLRIEDLDKIEFEMNRCIKNAPPTIGLGNEIFVPAKDLSVMMGKLRERFDDPTIDLQSVFDDLEVFMDSRSSVVPVFSGEVLFSDTIFSDEDVANNFPIRLMPVPLSFDDGSLMRVSELYLYSIFIIHCDDYGRHTWDVRTQQLFLNAQAAGNSGSIIVMTQHDDSKKLFASMFEEMIIDKSKFKLHLCSDDKDFQRFVDDLTALVETDQQ